MVERIKKYGAEMHDDMALSDHKEYHDIVGDDRGNPENFVWQDLDWILSPETLLTTNEKVEQNDNMKIKHKF